VQRRFPEFDVNVEIRRSNFVRTPRAHQRNWLLERTLDEFCDELRHLDVMARQLVIAADRPAMEDRWAASPAHYDDRQLVIQGQQVMQDWQHPLMAALARQVAAPGRDVLEIGFGMGISATYLQEIGVRSHTIVEGNDDVVAVFDTWRAAYPDRDIRLVSGLWQEALGSLGLFDGILFDAYPTSEQEYVEYVLEDVTYAAHFFPHAARHLRPGGVFTYYSNEIDSVGRAHQRLLLSHFRSFSVEVVRGLQPPEGSYNWWADSMAVIRATA
jgi:guanidinoacetate N-methyltransferase